MSEQQYNFETLQVHAGYTPDPISRSNSVPIYATGSFRLGNTARATRLFALQEEGNIYSRLSNPTLDAFEKRVAALEGGLGAVATASGQSAVFITLMTLAHAGENIVVSSNLYGGVYNMFSVRLPTFGVTCKFVDGGRPEDMAAAIDDKTRVVYVESISNPAFHVPDIEAMAKVAHDRGLPLVVDNTFGAGGYFIRPIEHGADIVVHSATKFLNGHGTTIGGILIDAGTFDWGKSADKFPDMAGPSKSYHGLNFWETFGHSAFLARIRAEMMRDIGACLSPFAAQQILVGLETLSLRADRFSSNALALGRWLQASPHVTWVLYPGLENHPTHDLAKRYCRRGFGGLLSFGINGGAEEGSKVVDSFKLIVPAANIGESKTMAIHCWETTHGQLKDEEKRSAGVTPELIRLAIGTEHIDDLIADFEQSFRTVFSTS
ncbi:hypothetical protein DL771_002491 [Monosporascus sp. 5C6A]|nr:hypothetical protein DL771_002491 [Monosporascus sp. 5C6A]